MSKLYEQLARSFQARQNCAETNNQEWFDKHGERIAELVRDHLPDGSGFDCGTKYDLDEWKPDRLVFYTSFHHMSDGMYDGWTEHEISVKPSLAFGFDLHITGPNRNDIKEYIADCFSEALSTEIEQ